MPRVALPHTALFACTLLALGLLATGCGDSESTHEFTNVRERGQQTPTVPSGMTSADRFGMRGRGGNPHAGVPGMDPHAGVPGMGAKAGGRAAPFTWTTPTGWEEVSGHAMRAATWRVSSEPLTDCSLSLLPGVGGAMLDNVNRWRGQMGAAPLSAEEVAALPRKPLLGAEAVFLNVEGRYAGMGGDKAIEKARMLGLLLSRPGSAVFLKFAGPTAVVAANEEAFLALAASVKPAAPAPAAQPLSTPPADRPAFKWSLPEGWELRQGRPGRVITVGPREAPGTECYLYYLIGDGGGVGPNINRWRSQMGQADLGDAQIAALEEVDVLGVKSRLVRIEGPFRGQSGEAVDGALLFGMTCLKEGYLLTAKMTGPSSSMSKEWDAFVSFCKSIKE
jgi:hypothetical protein